MLGEPKLDPRRISHVLILGTISPTRDLQISTQKPCVDDTTQAAPTQTLLAPMVGDAPGVLGAVGWAGSRGPSSAVCLQSPRCFQPSKPGVCVRTCECAGCVYGCARAAALHCLDGVSRSRAARSCRAASADGVRALCCLGHTLPSSCLAPAAPEDGNWDLTARHPSGGVGDAEPGSGTCLLPLQSAVTKRCKTSREEQSNPTAAPLSCMGTVPLPCQDPAGPILPRAADAWRGHQESPGRPLGGAGEGLPGRFPHAFASCPRSDRHRP